MASKRTLSLVLSALALCCSFWLAHAAWRYHQAQSFNTALARQDWDTLGRDDSPYGRFAAAYALQQQGEIQAALAAYSRIDSDSGPLRRALEFNMANSYLQRALADDIRDDKDLTLPLIELAKQGYRALLHHAPDHWEAKYNLERALQLLPDNVEQDIEEWHRPLSSPRATSALRADRELP